MSTDSRDSDGFEDADGPASPPSPRLPPAKGAPPPATMSPREGLVRDLCDRLSDAVGQGDMATARIAHRALGELLALPVGEGGEVVDIGSRMPR